MAQLQGVLDRSALDGWQRNSRQSMDVNPDTSMLGSVTLTRPPAKNVCSSRCVFGLHACSQTSVRHCSPFAAACAGWSHTKPNPGFEVCLNPMTTLVDLVVKSPFPALREPRSCYSHGANCKPSEIVRNKEPMRCCRYLLHKAR